MYQRSQLDNPEIRQSFFRKNHNIVGRLHPRESYRSCSFQFILAINKKRK